MRMSVVGVNLPGRTFCRPDGSLMHDVHVGVQLRREPAQLHPGDAHEARWELDVEVVDRGGAPDFRGTAVQGKPGERFVYLTWGDTGAGRFEMFRRAKLMLHRIEPELLRQARASGHLLATVDLTGRDGGPRCARVDPPAIEWSVPGA